jgi:hypothetical protein
MHNRDPVLHVQAARNWVGITQVLAKTAPDPPTEGIYEIDLAVNSEDYR